MTDDDTKPAASGEEKEEENVFEKEGSLNSSMIMLEHGIRGGIDEKSLPEPSRIQDNRDAFIAQC